MKCNYKVKRSVFRIRFVQDLGFIPRLGRYPGEGKDYSLQYSGLENSTVHGGSQRFRHNWVSLSLFRLRTGSQGKGLPGSSEGKESACNVEDLGSIPGLGRSSGEGNGNPLQYSCLENSTDRGTWRATVHEIPKSRTERRTLNFPGGSYSRENTHVTI